MTEWAANTEAGGRRPKASKEGRQAQTKKSQSMLDAVLCVMTTGKHLLTSRLTGFDPKRP
jgi:hypothetical protein